MQSSPTEAMSFVWEWRPYQRRVLDAVEGHLSDRRLHVVAAPGAGKTSLGLEVFRRLGKPALVLAPTRTIRNQWIERLADFLPGGATADWSSKDLDAPRFLTVVTYQALHVRTREQLPSNGGGGADEQYEDDEQEAADRSPTLGELDQVAAQLISAGVNTVILDEAHHLRQQWWRALARLCDGLGDVHLISLTATPPYDASGREWSRYEELCGPTDEEISVPELVAAGTLCPHQDYVYAVEPTPEESAAVCEHDRRVEDLCAELLEDTVFTRAVGEHPWLVASEPPSEDVFAQPELAIALLAFQRTRRRRLSRPLLRLFSSRPKEIPELDRSGWQVLLSVYLWKVWSARPEVRDHARDLRHRLRRAGLLGRRRELRIAESRPLRSLLSLSSAKIEACLSIHTRELALRGDGLRQVFLTDYVRDEGFRPTRAVPLQLGAWPLFRAIVQQSDSEPRIALLTGRLVILHTEHLGPLGRLLGRSVNSSPVPGLDGFGEVDASGGSIVRAITELLERGSLSVLVGTRALLGEGWDAPCVNSLVLASFVGSFVTSNQMRGRAIRIDRERPDKVASLWHLVCVETGSRSGRSDLEQLEQRFDTFVGLSRDGSTIESGMDRLALPQLRSTEDFEAFDREMLRRLGEIPALPERWRSAVEGASEGRVLPTLRTNPRKSFRRFFLLRTLRYVLQQALWTFLFLFGQGLRTSGQFEGGEAFALVVMFSAAAAFTVSLPGLLKAAWMLFRHLPVDGSVRQIALAVRDALIDADLLPSGKRAKVRTAPMPDGGVSVTLAGADFREQSLFAGSLAEVLGPIGDPRYLLTRRGRILRGRRLDYHSVPRLLGAKKELAHLLLAAWRRRLGRAELIYTRNPEGRKALFSASMRAFSSAFVPRAERADRWS